jgi:hypothetical protein
MVLSLPKRDTSVELYMLFPDAHLVEATAPGVRPKPAGLQWVREIRDLCRVRGVAFFHKQWGGRTPKSGGRRLDGREWSEYPALVASARQVAQRGDSATTLD